METKTAQKFTKKPVTIEAIKFTGGEHNERQLNQFIKCDKSFIGIPCHEIEISTLEGKITAQLGDYIIKGVKGEFYPCKPDIFEMTYHAQFKEDRADAKELSYEEFIEKYIHEHETHQKGDDRCQGEVAYQAYLEYRVEFASLPKTREGAIEVVHNYLRDHMSNKHLDYTDNAVPIINALIESGYIQSPFNDRMREVLKELLQDLDECEMKGLFDHINPYFIKSRDKARIALKESALSSTDDGWIPVEKELPKDSKTVLGFDGKFRRIVFYCQSRQVETDLFDHNGDDVSEDLVDLDESKGVAYLKCGWYSLEEDYAGDETYIVRNIVKWRNLPSSPK